jgi:hypothetical protein
VANDHGDWGGRKIVSDGDWRTGTEYGGVGGIIPPLDSPHTESMSAHEQWLIVRNIDPTDNATSPVEELKQMAP